jgi:hypothetical protein
MANTFDLNEQEQYLSNIQQSWADAANNWRTIGERAERVRRNKTGNIDSISFDELLKFNEKLEVWEKEYKAGDSACLLWAMRACMEQMLPTPYWVTDGFLQKIKELEAKPVSLHDLFRLNKSGLRASGNRAINDRRQNAIASKLYLCVEKIMKDDKLNERLMSKERAISMARTELNLAFSQGTARTIYDKYAATQAKFKRAL